MAASDEFCVVKRRRGKKSSGSKPVQNHGVTLDSNLEEDNFDLQKFHKRLNECMQDLLLSDFFQSSNDAIITALSALIESKTKQEKKHRGEGVKGSNEGLRPTSSEDPLAGSEMGKQLEVAASEDHGKTRNSAFKQIQLLSYGIGRFSVCPIARHQLAFLLTLKGKLNHPPCHVYDPVFTSQEKTTLHALGCSLIETNEEGKRLCPVPTVAFMPHCGKALYNNMIWANLSCPGHIHNLILVGNSFSSMIDRTPDRQLMRTANYVKKIIPYVNEAALPVCSSHSDVFNDLSIHTFPRRNFASLPSEFWSNNPEPSYDEEEAELVMREKTL